MEFALKLLVSLGGRGGALNIRRSFSLNKLGRCTTMAAVKDEFFKACSPTGSSNAASHPAALRRALAETEKAELEPKRMCDSRQQATLNVTADDASVRKYVNFQGHVRLGRLLEELDILGVLISYRHAWQRHWGESIPMAIVTASVDQVCLHRASIEAKGELRLSGCTSWVGRSSTEVSMRVERQAAPGEWEPLLDAKFVNAARHPLTGRGVPLNPLVLDSDEDRRVFRQGAQAKRRRLRLSGESLLSVVPRDEESELIHRLFVETLEPKSQTFSRRRLPANSVWMSDTMVKSLHLCQPEQMNVYGKVFGGFLMRKAVELAWVCAYKFCKRAPEFAAVKDISFRAPVEIGSLLLMSSQVTYTEPGRAVVRVHAEVLQPVTGQHTTTNDLYIVFSTADDSPAVCPQTYSEAMLYIDGRRHLFVQAECLPVGQEDG